MCAIVTDPTKLATGNALSVKTKHPLHRKRSGRTFARSVARMLRARGKGAVDALGSLSGLSETEVLGQRHFVNEGIHQFAEAHHGDGQHDASDANKYE